MNCPSSQNYNRSRTVFSFCFLLLLAVMGTASFAFFVKMHLSPQAPPPLCQNIPAVKSFRDLYPFQDRMPTHPVLQEKEKFLYPYWSRIHRLTYAIDGYTSRANPFSSPLQNVICRYDAVVKNNYIENGENPVFQLNNGYFTYLFPYSHSEECLKSISDFSAWLKSQGICYLTLLPAYKFDDSITIFPDYIPHGYAKMAEEYKSFLKKNNIPCLDAKPELLSAGKDFYFWFYRTDHHWNVHAGHLIAERTAQKLNDELKIITDAAAVKPEHFSLTVYPKSFRGSLAVRSTVQSEDFEILYPEKEGAFSIEIQNLGIRKNGTFKDTLIPQTYLFKTSHYCAFLYGDQPLIRIENKTCSNQTRILVIKSSYADVLCPYLARAVKYLDVIDPRFFDGSIRTFIARTQPDAVIVCACVPSAGDEKFWMLK